MLVKDYVKPPELVEDQKEHKKPEIHPMGEFMGHANLSVKMEMAKELYCVGLSRKAIGRILHLSEGVIDQQIEIPKKEI
jgi:hypothetical protein